MLTLLTVSGCLILLQVQAMNFIMRYRNISEETQIIIARKFNVSHTSSPTT